MSKTASAYQLVHNGNHAMKIVFHLHVNPIMPLALHCLVVGEIVKT
jgi:hypothetical protein